jgi:hypothetical protein
MLPEMFLLGCWVVAQILLVDKTSPFDRTQSRSEALGSLLRQPVRQRKSLVQRKGTSTHPAKKISE